MKCGLCGHEFSEQDAICDPACPLGGGCAIVCCPRCGYGAPDESRSKLLRLGRKVWHVAARRSRSHEVDADA
jgi:hypothetical protein